MGELKRLQEGKNKVDPLAANIYDFESASIPVKRKSTEMVDPTARDNESLKSVDTATQEDQAVTTLNVTL